jgi:hypothetical protein
MEQDDLNHHQIKDLKSSPETFTKEFLQSYKYKNNSTELISDLDDDNDQIKINKDKYESDVLSTSTTSTNQNESSSITDDIHQEKIHSNSTPKIDRRK